MSVSIKIEFKTILEGGNIDLPLNFMGEEFQTFGDDELYGKKIIQNNEYVQNFLTTQITQTIDIFQLIKKKLQEGDFEFTYIDNPNNETTLTDLNNYNTPKIVKKIIFG